MTGRDWPPRQGATGFIVGFARSATKTRLLFDDAAPGGCHRFTEGETTGVEPWPEFAEAKVAAAIPSGPDRHVDLEKLIPIDPSVGLVTGHCKRPT
ncbi:DUF6963 family protein [Bradyrhizobium sp. UFLA05-109]